MELDEKKANAFSKSFSGATGSEGASSAWDRLKGLVGQSKDDVAMKEALKRRREKLAQGSSEGESGG